MTLSSYRMHRIYLYTMGYGLGSDHPEELAYYKKLRKEMEDMKKDPVKKVSSIFEINEGNKELNTFLLIDGSLMLIGLPLLMILKGKKKTLSQLFNCESYSHYSSNIF